MPHFTTVASRCQSGFGLLAASHRSFVRTCRGGSRSCSAISPSLVGCGGHTVEPSRRRRRNSRRHRADTCARSSRQVSARFRRTAGRTYQFASAPLHCISATQAPLPLHCVPTAANCRDRQRQRCAQRCQRPRCSAYRPGQKYGRETTSGQDVSNSPRCFARARHQHYGARLRLSPRTRQ